LGRNSRITVSAQQKAPLPALLSHLELAPDGQRKLQFRERDLRRAIRAFEAEGVFLQRAEVIPDGRIVLILGDPNAVASDELKKPAAGTRDDELVHA